MHEVSDVEIDISASEGEMPHVLKDMPMASPTQSHQVRGGWHGKFASSSSRL